MRKALIGSAFIGDGRSYCAAMKATVEGLSFSCTQPSRSHLHEYRLPFSGGGLSPPLVPTGRASPPWWQNPDEDESAMVTAGMRRYKIRTPEQARLIGQEGHEPLDLPAMFGDLRPLRLEIGFGHGEFITAMAAVHPDESFIGVEHDPLRVTKTAHRGNKAGLDNIRLFAADAHSFVRQRMPTACLSRVYILFADPWPKPDHRRRRLVSRAFLLDLARICAPGCQFIFASDTHNYAMQVLSNASTLPGLWANSYLPAGYRINIPTRFPTLFETYKKEEGCSIAYLSFQRTSQPAPPPLTVPGDGRRNRKVNLRIPRAE